MTGSLIVRKTSKGKKLFYIVLSYKDPATDQWKQKRISTGLEVTGNKRKAQAMVQPTIDKYAFLETMSSTPVVTPNITICEYLDYWLQEKKRDIRDSTFEAYTLQVRKIQSYFLKSNPKVIDVDARMIDRFVKDSLDKGQIDQKTKQRKPLSVRTVRSLKSILHAMFVQAQIDLGIKYNPVSDIHVHGKKNSRYEREYLFLTEEELQELMIFISTKYPRLLGIVFFGAYYGLRRSEILGLRWSAVDFRRRKIKISRTVVRVKNIHAEEKTKTTASRRNLPLWDTAVNCLMKIRKEQMEYAAFFKNAYRNDANYVFTWEDGHPYDPNYISREFKKAMKAFGRPELSMHKLRHSCASLLISKGWDVKQVQYWLGHTDIETTLGIYAHYYKEKLDDHIDEMEEITAPISMLFQPEDRKKSSAAGAERPVWEDKIINFP